VRIEKIKRRKDEPDPGRRDPHPHPAGRRA
jgi:hypothetical protein